MNPPKEVNVRQAYLSLQGIDPVTFSENTEAVRRALCKVFSLQAKDEHKLQLQAINRELPREALRDCLMVEHIRYAPVSQPNAFNRSTHRPQVLSLAFSERAKANGAYSIGVVLLPSTDREKRTLLLSGQEAQNWTYEEYLYDQGWQGNITHRSGIFPALNFVNQAALV